MTATAHANEGDSVPRELTDQERAMLEVEDLWWKYSGVKEQVVWDRFEMSMTNYYQVLNTLIDSEAALAHSPLLVKRLRRVRERRQRDRSVRRAGANG